MGFVAKEILKTRGNGQKERLENSPAPLILAWAVATQTSHLQIITEETLLSLEVLKLFPPPVRRDVGGNKVAGKMSNIHVALYLCLRP